LAVRGRLPDIPQERKLGDKYSSCGKFFPKEDIQMSLTSIGVVLGIIASVLKIVNGIVDLVKKMPRKVK
jgi:hypothetical protein